MSNFEQRTRCSDFRFDRISSLSERGVVMQQDETRFESSTSSDRKRVGQQVAQAVSAAAHTAGHKMDATVDYAESVAHNVKDHVTTFYDRDLRDLKDRAL